MSSVLRRRRLALALAVTITFGLPATAGAMPAGSDAPTRPPARSDLSVPTDGGDDATLAIALVAAAAVAGGGITYASRHPRAVRLG
jgi:hypothetical protein